MTPTSATDRLAVCSWSLQPGSVAELVARVRETGLPAVQLALEPLLGPDAGWAGTAGALRAAGVHLVSGMMGCVGEDYTTIETIHRTGGVMPDETWPATLENVRRAAPIARDLGLKLVTFHAGFIPHDARSPDFSKAVQRVSAVADVFAPHGIHVALETGQEPAAALLLFLRALGRPDIGLNFDPANMLLYGSGEPIAALGQLLPHVKQVHIKDATPSGVKGQWGAEVPAGTGAVDWPAFFRLLGGAGYAGPFVIEREAGKSRVADVVTAARLVRAHVSNA